MDKYEYKVRAEEIKALIVRKEYAEAVKIADTIDWRRVKSVMMLCTVSDLYKINRRFDESKELLLLAYDRHPGGRMIIYSLCELSIKIGDIVQAVEYYKEFVQIAPKDTGRYILQYKLYEAQEVTLEERIAVLEEFKKRDYREKWAYELAYLYHRVGLATKCVEECDELILWFGKGKYVIKAMELKMLHQPLTDSQQLRYRELKGIKPLPPEEETEKEELPIEIKERGVSEAPTQEIPVKEMEIRVKPMRVGKYDTINLQKALAESMKEVLEERGTTEEEQETQPVQTGDWDTGEIEGEERQRSVPWERKEAAPSAVEALPEADTEDEEEGPGEFTREIVAPLLQNTDELTQITEDMLDAAEAEEKKEKPAQGKQPPERAPEPEPKAEEIFFEDKTAELRPQEIERQTQGKSGTQEQLKPEIAQILSQEYDGQIKLVVPDAEAVEKQITGQMSIEDVLTEWEKTKKNNEHKRAEEVRQRVLQQTGAMFSEFDASAKSGILAELDEAAAVREEEEKRREAAAARAADQAGEEKKQESAPATKQEDVQESGEVEEIILGETAEMPDNIESAMEAALEETSGREEEDEAEENAEETSETEEDEAGEKEAEKEAGAPKRQKTRPLTDDEKDLYGSFIQTKREKNQIIHAVDDMSLAPFTGNVIITGDAGVEKVELAKNLIKEIQMSDANFSGKVAKITGKALNKKDVEATLGKMPNGALIIEKAGDMTPETLEAMNKTLEKGKGGIIIIMEDTKRAVNAMLESYQKIGGNFTSRIDIEALGNDALVAYGKRYAKELEYTIDEFGILALYTKIGDMQTSEHVVTAAEVREMIDDAIDSANRKNLKHLMDILLGKRYDDEDMVILREKDFI